ncbi:MAG: hypothetical protein V2A71_05000 [Candidatus Eisenbacteria bacterium]
MRDVNLHPLAVTLLIVWVAALSPWAAAAAPHSDEAIPIAPSRFWLPDSLETGWLAADKKLHVLSCYSIVLTGRVADDKVETGVAAAVALSLAKELWDLWFKVPQSQRGVSKRDLIVDAIGIVAGVTMVELVDD